MGHTLVIQIVETDDQTGAVPADIAVQVHRVIPLIPEDAKSPVHMFFQWREGRGTNANTYQLHTVSSSHALLRAGEPRKEIQLEDVSDVMIL
jgi:hypothetical protein